jgi:molybdate transport system substrate-binding protein
VRIFTFYPPTASSRQWRLIREYERTPGHRINIQFGASATLKTSIEHGEPFDVAILTLQIIDDLIKQGKIASETLNPLARTDIGIAVRAGTSRPDVKTAGAVKRLLLKAETVGYVKEGASTPAILNMLNRLSIAEQIRRKMIGKSSRARSMALETEIVGVKRCVDCLTRA